MGWGEINSCEWEWGRGKVMLGAVQRGHAAWNSERR